MSAVTQFVQILVHGTVCRIQCVVCTDTGSRHSAVTQCVVCTDTGSRHSAVSSWCADAHS